MQLAKQVSGSKYGVHESTALSSFFPSTKGIKLSKVRIIQQTIVYVIGLSPLLADEAAIKRPENFG